MLVIAAGLLLFFKKSNQPAVAANQHQTEQFSLPTGEVITNETWVTNGPMFSLRHNKLSFRETASAPIQVLSPDATTMARPSGKITLANAGLFRYPDHVVLALDPLIFVFQKGNPGAGWKQSYVAQYSDTGSYLRIFSTPDNPVSGGPLMGPAHIPSFSARDLYHFDHLEDDGRTLLASRATDKGPFPKFLAYRLNKFWDWSFDIDATRQANQFPPPSDPGLTVDVSIVKFFGAANQNGYSDRDRIMGLPGSTEVYDKPQPLAATGWVTCDSAYIDTRGETVDQPFKIHFGFWDLSPGYLLVFLNWNDYIGAPYQYIRLGQWQFLGGTGYGDASFATFYRVRKN